MSSSTTIVKPTIFREYIGSKPYPGKFHDFPAEIINPKIKEFHFIIAFAREIYDESGKGTGMFEKKWIVPNIDGTMIGNLKNKYESGTVNVKVIISIGSRSSAYPFNPAETKRWPEIARASLLGIINDLKDQWGNTVIDGIDINYNTISSDDVSVFADCIERLIKSLKKHRHLVISIAPADSVQAHYRALYNACKEDIDWVNYQFYTQTITSEDEFQELYRQLADKIYTRQKLLAGFSTDPGDEGNLSPHVFIKACDGLIKNKALPGIFIWNANDSALTEPPFEMGRDAQKLLTQN